VAATVAVAVVVSAASNAITGDCTAHVQASAVPALSQPVPVLRDAHAYTISGSQHVDAKFATVTAVLASSVALKWYPVLHVIPVILAARVAHVCAPIAVGSGDGAGDGIASTHAADVASVNANTPARQNFAAEQSVLPHKQSTVSAVLLTLHACLAVDRISPAKQYWVVANV
jgi:hypothetical protein